MFGGVTVISGTAPLSRRTLLGVDGLDLDFGDSTVANFGTFPVPEKGLCGEPEGET